MICVQSIKIDLAKMTLREGEWCSNMTFEISPFNATYSDVEWYSDDPNVAIVNKTSGYIYAKAPGKARIYAVAVDGSGCSDYVIIDVIPSKKIESLKLNQKKMILREGESGLLSTEISPSNIIGFNNIIWCSSDTNVVKVNGGTVCAISSGKALVTASASDGSGICDFCEVTVGNPYEKHFSASILID